MVESDFDKNYFERFYFCEETRVAERCHYDRSARFLISYLDFINARPETVLDAGCGTGWIHRGLLAEIPTLTIKAFDVSTYVSSKYGWDNASILDYQNRDKFDLVICNDVLQYLNDTDAGVALERLASWTCSVLYFSVLTTEDWERNCDRKLTDGSVYLRPANWYRKKLRTRFRNLGGGLYVRADCELVIYELESL